MKDAADGLIGKAEIKITPEAAVVSAAPVVADPVIQGPVLGAPVIVKSPLGDQVYGGTPLKDVVLASFTDVQNFAKDYMGLEIKEVKDFVPLFAQFKTAKEQASQATELQKLVDGYSSTLDNLPSDVSLILGAAMQGEDYKPILQKMVQKTVIDYQKPFEAHDPVKLVNHYTGKAYTKETFDALDETAKSALSDSVKLKFDTDRTELLNFETNTKKATEQKQEKFLASVESSISAMLTSNPQMGKAAVDRVRQVMRYGIADVLFTKDKTYVPDAAEKIAFMEFGKETVAAQAQTIGDIVKKIQNQSASDVTEKILLRSDLPPIQGGGRSNNLIAAAVEEATSFLPKRK
jgi:hypothetical protein